jgi:hypothetical protein
MTWRWRWQLWPQSAFPIRRSAGHFPGADITSTVQARGKRHAITKSRYFLRIMVMTQTGTVGSADSITLPISHRTAL